MKDITIQVDGMSCNHCKMAVESELKKVAGIINAEVNLADKSVKVLLEDENLSIEALYEAIKEAGFEPVK